MAKSLKYCKLYSCPKLKCLNSLSLLSAALNVHTFHKTSASKHCFKISGTKRERIILPAWGFEPKKVDLKDV